MKILLTKMQPGFLQIRFHCPPVDSPAGEFFAPVRFEIEVDNVASAPDSGWQVAAAALLHQSCPVPVPDFQAVVAAVPI